MTMKCVTAVLLACACFQFGNWLRQYVDVNINPKIL